MGERIGGGGCSPRAWPSASSNYGGTGSGLARGYYRAAPLGLLPPPRFRLRTSASARQAGKARRKGEPAGSTGRGWRVLFAFPRPTGAAPVSVRRKCAMAVCQVDEDHRGQSHRVSAARPLQSGHSSDLLRIARGMDGGRSYSEVKRCAEGESDRDRVLPSARRLTPDKVAWLEQGAGVASAADRVGRPRAGAYVSQLSPPAEAGRTTGSEDYRNARRGYSAAALPKKGMVGRVETPNQSWQPTPVGRRSRFPSLLTRRGCVSCA